MCGGSIFISFRGNEHLNILTLKKSLQGIDLAGNPPEGSHITPHDDAFISQSGSVLTLTLSSGLLHKRD